MLSGLPDAHSSLLTPVSFEQELGGTFEKGCVGVEQYLGLAVALHVRDQEKPQPKVLPRLYVGIVLLDLPSFIFPFLHLLGESVSDYVLSQMGGGVLFCILFRLVFRF